MKTLPCFPTDEDIEKYRKDPASFVKDVFGIELLPCQEELIKNIMKESQNDEKEIYQIAYGRLYRTQLRY